MDYLELVETYRQLESTTKRLQKTFLLAEFLKIAPTKELEKITLLAQGKVFPDWDERVIGIAARLVIKAIGVATGVDAEKIEESWKKTGDLGDVAEKMVGKKKQSTLFSQKLTVTKVFDNLQKLAELEGPGTVDRKVQLVAELLTSAKPLEAKYIIRTILGELRVGLGEGTLRDAIVWAFFGKEIGLKYDAKENELVLPDKNRDEYNKYLVAVQEAYDAANDYAVVAEVAKEKGIRGLQNIELAPGKPIKVMLYQKAIDMADAFETVGKPAALEYKYDGFRMQIHKFSGKIIIYTRRLENVTKQFPEVVEFVKENVDGSSFILDCEAVGFDRKTGKYRPFQEVSQRIKRKYSIEEIGQKFPVELNIFDIVYYDGKNLTKVAFEERRKILAKIVANKKLKIKIAEQIVTGDDKEADKFYKDSLKAGNEGVMVKNLQGIYKPGSRVGYGVKVKPTMETLDVAIVGAEWGEGKRARWLSSFMIAVRDPETNELLEIGRVGTGIKEKEEEGVSFAQLTEMLKPLIIEEKGKEVKVRPKFVIEINYEEIQASPTYSSGYALRFPRLCKLREDRRVDEISTLDEVKKLYYGQRGRKKIKI